MPWARTQVPTSVLLLNRQKCNTEEAPGKPTLRDSMGKELAWTRKVLKPEKTMRGWRIDPHWIRETCQLSIIYDPGLEPRKKKMTSARSEGPQVTHYFPIWVIAPCFKNHICLFVIYLFIVCLYVGGCACLSEHVESDDNQQQLVLSFSLWVSGI